MNKYLLMLQGGQEACIEIEAFDMGHALRICKEKLAEGWNICKCVSYDTGFAIHVG